MNRKSLENSKERVQHFTEIISQYELPFDWKRFDRPAEMYQGQPYTVTATPVCEIKTLCPFLLDHELSYMFGGSIEKRDVRDLWIGISLLKRDGEHRKFNERLIGAVEDAYEDSDMVAFQDAWIQNKLLVIRSADLS